MLRRRVPWALFAAVAMGCAACGVLLGDYPDGHLEATGPDGDGVKMPPGAPEGSICIVPKGVVLDMAVDDSDVFWIHAPAPGGQDFTIETCAKGAGSKVRTIATVSAPPEAMALSEKNVFWTINDQVQHFGGTWRADKHGGFAPTSAWLKYDYPGALTYASGRLYTALHPNPIGFVSIDIPESDPPQYGILRNIGDPIGVAVGDAGIFWAKREARSISWVPHVTQSEEKPFAGAFPSPPTFLTYDHDTLYWALVGPAGGDILARCATGCTSDTRIVTVSAGFMAFAIRDGGLYWTSREAGGGAVRACRDLAHPPCPDPQATPPLWSGNADVSRITLDASHVYFAARAGDDTYIVKRPR